MRHNEAEAVSELPTSGWQTNVAKAHVESFYSELHKKGTETSSHRNSHTSLHQHNHPHRVSSVEPNSTSGREKEELEVSGPEVKNTFGSNTSTTNFNDAVYTKSSGEVSNACASTTVRRFCKDVDHETDHGCDRNQSYGKVCIPRDCPSGRNNIKVNHMEYELERETDKTAASSVSRGTDNGRNNGERTHSRDERSTSRRPSQACPSDDETVASSEQNEGLNSSSSSGHIVNSNAIEDGRDWLERELERIYNNGSGRGGISGGHLSSAGHILTSSSDGPHDMHAIHNTQDSHEITTAVGYQPSQNQISLLNGVLSTHLGNMDSDNEASNYMDRVARVSASSAASTSVVSSSSAATTLAPMHIPRPQRKSARRSSKSLGKRSHDSSDMDGETLTGDGSPPHNSENGPSSHAQDHGPDDANNPAKKMCIGRLEEDLRIICGQNRYSKNMKTPEPFPHERPPASFEDDYRVNLAISMQVATGEIEAMPGPSTSTASTASATTGTSPATAQVEPSAPRTHAPPPSAPPTRPLPSIPTAQAMPPSPTRQTMSTAPVAPVIQPMQPAQPVEFMQAMSSD